MIQELEMTLHQEIPLTKAMSLRVREASPDIVRLYLPIEPNINHKKTAFGGSLYSGAVLAGWGLLWCTLQEFEISAQIVIASSDMQYLLPVSTHFEAVCVGDEEQIDQAIKVLKRRGKAKVELESVISCKDQACASLIGTYGLIRV